MVDSIYIDKLCAWLFLGFRHRQAPSRRGREGCLTDKEEICREIYKETQSFYGQMAPLLGSAALGFRVLYGPPILHAPFLFIGNQPGGRAESVEDHDGWPRRCDYAVAEWPLAKRMRQIWHIDLLERCTGLNANFFRAPSVRSWRSLDARLRQDCEAFSQQRAYRILKTLAPKRIVVIGLETFSLLTHGDPVLSNGSRVLVKRGELCGVEAFGVIHLSGARTSRSEVEMISGFFAKGLASEVAPTAPIAPSAKPV
jgi:hypothetical protein